MGFEYDQDKSVANKVKHGIDFNEAQALWDDPDRVEVPARDTDEPRWLVVGKIGDKAWSAVVTYRNDNIRLISVRRSRKEEVQIYESLGI
ncbi:MAG TPA: BrnT family toxin [Methylococcaceae bacterium]|nr:BrnT family toxin [Methylococcaceae bacterium]